MLMQGGRARKRRTGGTQAPQMRAGSTGRGSHRSAAGGVALGGKPGLVRRVLDCDRCPGSRPNTRHDRQSKAAPRLSANRHFSIDGVTAETIKQKRHAGIEGLPTR